MHDVGLPSHPFYERAKKQMKGYSGMVTFYIKGGLQEAKTFLSNMEVWMVELVSVHAGMDG